VRILLDTSSLIDLIERSQPCSLDHFENDLRSRGDKLLLSTSNILEISAPLLHPNPRTNVMGVLTRLDRLPIEYISGARNLVLELEEAVSALADGREYGRVHPYVNRFDFAMTVWGEPVTANFIGFGLPEVVFTLWNETPEILNPYRRYARPLQELFERDRSLKKKPSLRDHFVVTIERNLGTARITVAPQNIARLARWIYNDCARCPGIRLGYEVYHRHLKNLGDKPKAGDFADREQIQCIPYADIVTIDRRMRSYVSQACDGAGLPYRGRLYANLSEALIALRARRSSEGAVSPH